MDVYRLSPAEQARHRHVPAVDRERARIVVVPVLTPGVRGMTLGRWVLVRRGHERDRGLLAHELVHVRQWREHGAARFLIGYVGAYLRSRVRGLGHREAYLAIPSEVEARRVARR
ncbi:MAG: DUF4157 domain-containing protein [Acidimicrobiia bacterium]|nr:DUF4157 domain-containing protein [Acidimicrobiia bacterium]